MKVVENQPLYLLCNFLYCGSSKPWTIYRMFLSLTWRSMTLLVIKLSKDMTANLNINMPSSTSSLRVLFFCLTSTMGRHTENSPNIVTPEKNQMENVAVLTYLRFNPNIKGPESNSFTFFSQSLAVFRQWKLG